MNKLVEIRMPADTVYFIDHEYYFAVSWTFNPTRSISYLKNLVSSDTYKFRTRWHNKKPNADYGIGDIGWVDGHASTEPRDFANVETVNGSRVERWRYYFYNH